MSSVRERLPPRRARIAKLALGLGISGLFLYATLATVPFGEVIAVLRGAQPAWIVGALASLAGAYAVKVLRWKIMLSCLGAKVRTRDAAAGFLGAVAFNNVLPFRAGDIIRVVAFQRLTGVPASGQVGTLALERLLDLLVLTILFFATITFWNVGVVDEALLTGLRLIAMGVAAAILIFIAAPGPLRQIVRWVVSRMPMARQAGEALLRLLDAVQALSRPAFLVRATALSFLAWLLEGGVFYSVGYALGVAARPEAALLALSVGTLSTIIPSSPGYVGTFHYFTARAVAAFGAGQAESAAYALLVHAILWLCTTATGFVLLGLVGVGGKRRLASSRAAFSQRNQSE